MRLPCRYGIANEFTNVKGFLCCGSLNSFTEDSLSLSCKVNRKSSTKQQVMLCPSLSVSKCSSPWSMSNAAKQFDRDLGRALCNYQSPDITSTWSATSTQRSRDFSILSFPGPNLFKIFSRRSSKSQRRARPNVTGKSTQLSHRSASSNRDGEMALIAAASISNVTWGDLTRSHQTSWAPTDISNTLWGRNGLVPAVWITDGREKVLAAHNDSKLQLMSILSGLSGGFF